MSTTTVFKPGDVLQYRPLGRFEPWHCREGFALVDESGRAIDTYWGDHGDRHVLTADEMDNATVEFNVGDYDELDRWGHKKAEWETYHPDDRRRFTEQHGHHERLFIRRGAKPDLETQIANAREAVEQAHLEVLSAQHTHDLRVGQLNELEARQRALVVASQGQED